MYLDISPFMFRTVTLQQKHRKRAQAAMEAVQAVGTGLQAYLITARFTFIFEISLSLKFAIFFQKESNGSNDGNLDVDEKYMEEEDLDEARSLTARYVQRSPTVPIKVK